LVARRLKNHLQAFGLVGAPAPVVAEEPTQAVVQEPAEVVAQGPATEQSAVEEQKPVVARAAAEIAKVKTKKATGKKE
jgi:hypothetical protein